MVSALRIQALWVLSALVLAGCGVPVTPVAEGFDIHAAVRPPITEDGRVGVLRGRSSTGAFVGTRVEVSNGAKTSVVDLAPYGLQVAAFGKPLQISNDGDVVFGGRLSVAPTGCPGQQQGVYRMRLSGGAPTPLWEACVGGGSGGSLPALQPYVSMSPNRTVAFSMINSSNGAILRGPVAGPMTTLRAGTGEFYNTHDLAVNDAGQVALNMEYLDGVAGGLMRGVPVFSTPGQVKAATPFAIEKQSVGALNKVAINSGGSIAVVIPVAVTLTFGATTQTFAPGIYRARATLWNTPKDLTLAFARGTACRIGNIDINDAGTIVFEITYSEYSCGIPDTYDALVSITAAGVSTVIAIRGEEKFGSHQYFDSVRLGEINNAGQVSFLTTYSEPLAFPVMVWRAY
jgi:hypothetical protein